MRASWSVSRGFYSKALPTVEVCTPPEGGGMAQAFVNSKIQPGKVVMFIKPTYCRRTQEFLSQLPFKQAPLEFAVITANGNINEIQDYLNSSQEPERYLGSSLVEYIGGCIDLVNMHERQELLTWLKQIGVLQ